MANELEERASRAERLQGTIERRRVSAHDFELRATTSGPLEFSGHPALFDTPYEMYGGPDKGGWIETVNRKAFNQTLSMNPDVCLNVDHGESLSGLPIARTTAPGPTAKLNLSTDKLGLFSQAPLDPMMDDDVRQLQQKFGLKLIEQMSYAFRTIRQIWNEDYTERELLELDLNRGDVSIVTNGANAATSSQLRGLPDLLEALSALDPTEALVEARALGDLDGLVSAHTVLGRLIVQMRPADQRRTSVAHAERLLLLDA